MNSNVCMKKSQHLYGRVFSTAYIWSFGSVFSSTSAGSRHLVWTVSQVKTLLQSFSSGSHPVQRGSKRGVFFPERWGGGGGLEVRDHGSFSQVSKAAGKGQSFTIIVGRSALVKATVSFGSQQWPPQLGTKKKEAFISSVERWWSWGLMLAMGCPCLLCAAGHAQTLILFCVGSVGLLSNQSMKVCRHKRLWWQWRKKNGLITQGL